MAIIDVITFNGEDDLFEIRYNVLKDYVDEFRVIEFDQTFSGKPKTPLFTQNWPKVKYYFVTEDIWSKYKDLAKLSPNTQYGKGAEHWVREFCQKESIKDCLTDLEDNDIVFIGDCDEIWDRSGDVMIPLMAKVENEGKGLYDKPLKLGLQVYSYYLNNSSSEKFWGTLLARYYMIKGKCLNELRSNSDKTGGRMGWHFTSMGGYENVKRKLEDSYTEDSYANPGVMNRLEENLEENKDFLGRSFTYKNDELDWPEFLKHNKEKYKHLLKDGEPARTATKQ